MGHSTRDDQQCFQREQSIHGTSDTLGDSGVNNLPQHVLAITSRGWRVFDRVSALLAVPQVQRFADGADVQVALHSTKPAVNSVATDSTHTG